MASTAQDHSAPLRGTEAKSKDEDAEEESERLALLRQLWARIEMRSCICR